MPRAPGQRSLRWVDEQWWRDWLFWAACLVSTVVLLSQLGQDIAWWRYALGWVAVAAFATGVLGFLREVVRGFRGADRHDDR